MDEGGGRSAARRMGMREEQEQGAEADEQGAAGGRDPHLSFLALVSGSSSRGSSAPTPRIIFTATLTMRENQKTCRANSTSRHATQVHSGKPFSKYHVASTW